MTNKLIIGAIIGFLVWGLLELLLDIGIWPILIGVVVGGVAVVVLLARARGESPQQVAREVVQAARSVVTEPASTTEERAAYEQLLQASTAFVTSGADLVIHGAVKDTVLKLRALVARALEFYPESETTFNVVKLAKEDLPKLITAFVDLSLADQRASSEKFSAQLAAVSSKLSKISSTIDRGRQDQFDAESSFVDLKFS